MAAVKDRVATVSGVFLVPGRSLNNRLYSREVIAKAVARMQQVIETGAGDVPVLTMLTHHEAEDDSTRIVGRLTRVFTRETDGAGCFEADLADTHHGRDIAALAQGEAPYLASVSIRGYWIGDVRTVTDDDGVECLTGDELVIEGIDWTKSPGVVGARIETVRVYESRPARTRVSKEARVTETTTAQASVPAEECLIAVDPDMDGDIDAFYCPSCGSVRPAPPLLNIDQEDDDNMDETNKTGAETAAETADAPKAAARVVHLTESDVQAIVRQSVEAAIAAIQPAAPADQPAQAETPQSVAESLAELKAGLKDEILAAVRQELQGIAGRKGVVSSGESTTVTKPVHEMTAEEWHAFRAERANALLPTSGTPTA